MQRKRKTGRLRRRSFRSALHLLPYVIDNVCELLRRVDVDVFRIFVTPRRVTWCRVPHLASPNSLLTAIGVPQVERTLENIAPMRALAHVVLEPLEDRRTICACGALCIIDRHLTTTNRAEGRTGCIE